MQSQDFNNFICRWSRSNLSTFDEQRLAINDLAIDLFAGVATYAASAPQQTMLGVAGVATYAGEAVCWILNIGVLLWQGYLHIHLYLGIFNNIWVCWDAAPLIMHY